MNLGEAKTKAIQYIKAYSNDGQLTTAGENADYLLSMNTYVYDALLEIVDKIGLTKSMTITQTGATSEGYNEYALPVDYKRIIKVYLDDKLFTDYQIETGKFKVAKSYNGTFKLVYYKLPNVIDNNTADSYTFEVPDNYSRLIPYYVGGMAISDENTVSSDKLLNIYYEKLNELKPSYDDNPHMTINAYGGFDAGGGGW